MARGKVDCPVRFILKTGFDTTTRCCVGLMPVVVPTLPETVAKASGSPVELAAIDRAAATEGNLSEGCKDCEATLTCSCEGDAWAWLAESAIAARCPFHKGLTTVGLKH